ncbi:hypothetical protein FZI85_25150 [Mycobacterium sp. CBMA293]|uniref:hypothetical protein n=1 Tax=unclassified Mycolicibacterium TaxID=2636767 RepID=UPI0012DC0FE6|nr:MULTISPECIES: hypothetical protein [unclassified Mycolicibacterium]MUL47605.1 hypothetical protein [Mycolicibacterium sp. CBMA 360]MUL61877.1 hypothetical protein [Mycolicibacterium sp. CBMA 335]MUL68950.1 hypothetical protein [Mycolicibacterium sp. CBMA 311]MUL92833.1 hypothetical protein [Mycolicibacterium sp. CBMA 230]MUM08725.1 hypothetical protein [Mycolicibacterium sp. CBMA 213]
MTVVAPDVEELAKGCTADALAGQGLSWPVKDRTPDPRPARFVKLIVTGGRKGNLRIAQYLVTARVHTPLGEAAECGRVAREIAGALEWASETDSPVARTNVESCARLDDPDLKETAVYQVVVSWLIAIPV